MSLSHPEGVETIPMKGILENLLRNLIKTNRTLDISVSVLFQTPGLDPQAGTLPIAKAVLHPEILQQTV